MPQAKPMLTLEQQQAHDELVSYARGKDFRHKTKLLEGYAGTGKTRTISDVIHTLKHGSADNPFDSIGEIGVTAPTHKAVRVLRKFSDFADEVTFGTIHSILGLKEEIDTRTGKQKFVPDTNPNKEILIDQLSVLIIDEVSMLPNELYSYIKPHIKRGLKVIYLGDPVQIPPVQEGDSPVFTPSVQQMDNIGVIKLTKIMRQAAENPILSYATDIRNEYKLRPGFDVHTKLVTTAPDRGVIRINTGDDPAIHAILEEHFACDAFKHDSDHMKVIAWRNATVNAYNTQVRKHIYKDVADLPFLMENEKLIMDKPLILPSTRRIILSTNEEIEVKEYDVKVDEFEYSSGDDSHGPMILELCKVNLKYYNTTVTHFHSITNQLKEVQIRILHETEQSRFNAILEGIKKAALATSFGSPVRNKLWQSYFKFQMHFAQVKYNYAITAHKSQGSTYESAMVIDWDIDMNSRFVGGKDIQIEERNRIRYVAATRARNLLYIVK